MNLNIKLMNLIGKIKSDETFLKKLQKEFTEKYTVQDEHQKELNDVYAFHRRKEMYLSATVMAIDLGIVTEEEAKFRFSRLHRGSDESYFKNLVNCFNSFYNAGFEAGQKMMVANA